MSEEEIEEADVIETSEEITAEEILKNYDTIVEKIVVKKSKNPI